MTNNVSISHSPSSFEYPLPLFDIAKDGEEGTADLIIHNSVVDKPSTETQIACTMMKLLKINIVLPQILFNCQYHNDSKNTFLHA